MARYRTSLVWTLKDGEDFAAGRYSRGHTVTFEDGPTVPGTASHQVVGKWAAPNAATRGGRRPASSCGGGGTRPGQKSRTAWASQRCWSGASAMSRPRAGQEGRGASAADAGGAAAR